MNAYHILFVTGKKAVALNKAIVLLLFLLLTSNIWANWSNFIINYNKNLYGKGSQIWKIASYDENWMYFANQNGMLQYDGNEWMRYTLNNRSDVRSVHASTQQKRIYAGGINEFGYFEPGMGGQLMYTCLSDSLTSEDKTIGNIWGIYETDNMMYIVGDSKVIKYINGKYTTIETGRKIDCSNLVNGVLYIGTDNGVMLLIGNTFFPLQDGEILITKRIRGIIPHLNGMLVVTAYDGLYYNDGQQTKPYIIGAEEFMKSNEVFCAARSGHQIALGTVHKGIILFDANTKSVKYFNENNGLQNNTVLSTAFDPHGNLWAGLDSGIDYVCINSSLTNLYTYPYSYGTGYTAILHNNYMYLGTNRGLYYTNYPVVMNDDRPDIQAIPQSSGQVWNLKKIGDELFCLHDRGLFLVEGLALKKVGYLSGVWTCQLLQGEDRRMYVGVYDGIYLLEKGDDNQWKVKHKIAGTTDSFRYFEQESPQIIWRVEQKIVTRVELDINLTKVLRQTHFEIQTESQEDLSVYISKVGERIYFSSSKGISRYNPHTNNMELSQEMNNLLNGMGPYYSIVEYNDHIIGLNKSEICISNRVTYKIGAGTFVLPLDVPAIELVPGAEVIVPLSDSLLVVPNDNGFALTKIPDYRKRKDYSKIVHIRNVFISYPKDSLIYTNNFIERKEIPDVPYSQNSLRFEYGITSFTHGEDVRYQYKLDKDNWSDLTKSLVKEYSNLPEGEHTFEVKALFSDAMSATDVFTFHVLPPWYRTNAAYICYFAFFILMLWGIYRWDDIRVQKKKQQVVVEKDKELQAKEKEFERENARKEKQIIQLEKEKLQHDLQHKSQEMANLMINFVRKNEMLTEIKSDILKVISALRGESTRETKQMLLVVNNKIDSNIQSDEVLKRIEEQFDLVHNNFMKRLQEKHPDLSVNERMMCAYLKMNLSTKEIAPLLNISIRGVETIRYRIRKKFTLEREDSLTEYLNNRI